MKKKSSLLLNNFLIAMCCYGICKNWNVSVLKTSLAASGMVIFLFFLVITFRGIFPPSPDKKG